MQFNYQDSVRRARNFGKGEVTEEKYPLLKAIGLVALAGLFISVMLVIK